MSCLILTDNKDALKIAREISEKWDGIDIRQSPGGKLPNLPSLDIHDRNLLFCNYNLILSLHCKQIFPELVVNSFRCINVHPGFNPYNRGWFPHVFSIINGLKSGVTIHEIDLKIDHGPIIAQVECPIDSHDTSHNLYRRIMVLERELILLWFPSLVKGDYNTFIPNAKGNYNSKSDYNNLCQLHLDRVGTFREFLNILRALSHEGFDNAYYFEPDGEKVYVSLSLQSKRTKT